MLFLLNLKKKTSFSISEQDVCLHFAFEELSRKRNELCYSKCLLNIGVSKLL